VVKEVNQGHHIFISEVRSDDELRRIKVQEERKFMLPMDK